MSDYDFYGAKEFHALAGKTLTKVSVSDDKDRIEIEDADGGKYVMHHSQDCCEHVYIESVAGDLEDLIGAPLLLVEAVESRDTPDGFRHDYEPESQTWTFYKLATIKGGVTIRWFGSSNGYYSESVTFAKVSP